MNAFNVAYRAKLAQEVKCPRCHATNLPSASATIEIDQTGTRAFCSSCAFERPVAAFLTKDAA